MKTIQIATLIAQLLFSQTVLARGVVPELIPAPGLEAEAFGDWAVVCGNAVAGHGGIVSPNERMCEASIVIMADGATAPSARITLLKQAKNKPMRLVAIVPAAVSIPAGIHFTFVPGEPGINLIYKFCVVAACVAEAELAEIQMVMFQNLSQTGSLTYKDPNGKEIELGVSLKGLQGALDALLKR